MKLTTKNETFNLSLPENDAMSNFQGLPVLVWVEISLYKQSIGDSKSQTKRENSFLRGKEIKFRRFDFFFFFRRNRIRVDSFVSLSHCVG